MASRIPKARRAKFRKPRRRRERATTPAYILKAPHRRPTLLDTPPGICRMCGDEAQTTGSGKPRSWHWGRDGEPNCWDLWKMQTRPAHAKQAVAKLRGSKCEKCGKRGRGYKWLHLDHIVPLADLGGFGIENMQLLCPACHMLKTSTENSERAAHRKTVRAAAAAAAFPAPTLARAQQIKPTNEDLQDSCTTAVIRDILVSEHRTIGSTA